MQQHFFSFESSELQKSQPSSSHCSSVQERLVTYGSEALDTAEHLGLILGSQKQADALLNHFGPTQGKLRQDLIELDSGRKNAFIAAARSTEIPLILFWFWFQLPF
jgi:DNA repair protein RadC